MVHGLSFLLHFSIIFCKATFFYKANFLQGPAPNDVSVCLRGFVNLSPSINICQSVSVTISVIQSVLVILSVIASVSLSLSVHLGQHVSVSLTLSLPVCPCLLIFTSVAFLWISNAFLEKMTIWLQRISAITDKKSWSLDFR